MTLPSHFSLPPRLLSVVKLMCAGYSSGQIAERLHLSPHTIKDYRKVIFERMGVRNVVELVNKMNQLQGHPDEPHPTPSLDEGDPELLVVEDEAIIRELVVSGLQQAGFKCRGAASSSEVECFLNDGSPDIVILDLNLDGEDGLEIAQALRPRLGCGVIMMTTRGQIEHRLEGLERGADAYLVKPVDLRELIAVIRSLQRRRVEWALRRPSSLASVN